jgi:thiol-disulfide isomerase/thioredoxin
MKGVFILLYLLKLTLGFKLFKGVIVAEDNNFEDVIGNKGTYTLVNFYSVGCEHCQKLAPKYEPLAILFNGTSVQIAQLEGRINKRIRTEEKIRGFPTMRLYHFDGTHVASFTGDRTTERLAQFVTDHTGVQARWPKSKVMELKGSDKVEDVINGNKGRLCLALSAPWVEGWSDKFNHFERVAQKFPDVQFVSVDATNGENSRVISKYRVSSYPTLVYLDHDDSPLLRVLEVQKANEATMIQFLQGEIGDQYSSLGDLQEDKSRYNPDKEPHKQYGFNRFGDGGEDDDEEKFKKLREL